MKQLFIIILTLTGYSLHAQDWKKYAVLQSGDTVYAGNKLKVADVPLQYIQPSMSDVNGVPFNSVRVERNKRFASLSLAGNTYKIERLSRVKVSGKYIPIAILLIGDYSMSPADNTPFTVYLDKAITSKEIEIIK